MFVYMRVCDPDGIWFEPLLAHFEQLCLVYEMKDEEEDEKGVFI